MMSGVDLNVIRDHFGLEKAYMLEQGQGGYSHRGQGDEIDPVKMQLNLHTHLYHLQAATNM